EHVDHPRARERRPEVILDPRLVTDDERPEHGALGRTHGRGDLPAEPCPPAFQAQAHTPEPPRQSPDHPRVPHEAGHEDAAPGKMPDVVETAGVLEVPRCSQRGLEFDVVSVPPSAPRLAHAEANPPASGTTIATPADGFHVDDQHRPTLATLG